MLFRADFFFEIVNWHFFNVMGVKCSSRVVQDEPMVQSWYSHCTALVEILLCMPFFYKMF